MNVKLLRKVCGRVAALTLSLCATARADETISDETISEDVTLTADADWRSKGTVTIAEGVTVDLNGYTLTVKGLICNGSIVDVGYEFLTYIQFSRTQWIDTGIVPNKDKAGVEMDFTTLNENANRALFGAGEETAKLILDLSDGATYSMNGTCNVPCAVIDSELTDDCDLRTLGTVRIDGRVALNGHALQVAGTTGRGAVFNQSGRYRYTHYRFKVDAIGNAACRCLAFSDLRLFSFGVDVTGQRSGASAGAYGYNADLSYLKALDGSVNNKWCVDPINNFDDLWVQVDYAEPIQITKYEWWSTDDGLQRDRAPIKWRFQGSNDGATWTDLDVVSRAYADNPATSKTLAYTFDTGFTLLDATGEFHVEVPEGNVATNTLTIGGDVKLFKEGDGTLIETQSTQEHEAGEVVVAGTLFYEPQNYVVPGDLTLAGGTLAVEDGNPPTVGGTFAVTVPSQIKLLTDDPTGHKPLVAQVGEEFDPKDLTVVLEPEPTLAVPYSFSVENGNLRVFFGDPNEVAAAIWTGAIDGDVAKSGNWRCLNGSGAELKGRIPGEHTSIQIRGDINIQIPVGTQLAYQEVLFGDCRLTANADWRGLAAPINGTINLDGHTLQLARFSGSGTITQPVEGKYKFYRFKIDAIGSGSCLALSDLRLFSFGVDVTGQRSGASAGAYGYNADLSYLKALDGSVNNKWCVDPISSYNSLWVQVDYAEPILITRYEWWSTDDGLQRNRAPTQWRFQGSNDGMEWTDLDVVSRAYADNPATSKTLAYRKFFASVGQTVAELHADVPAGEIENSSPVEGGYKSYRFKVDAIGSGSCLALSDLRLFSFDVDVTGQRSGASAGGGAYGYNAELSYLKALDGSVNNKWCVNPISNYDGLWVQVDYAEPIQITQYEWWSTDDLLQRDRAPTQWRFQGSNDGTTWTDLDVVSRAYADNPTTSKTLAYRKSFVSVGPTVAELHVDVPSGEIANSSIAIDGNVKLVKDGSGTFVATKAGQTYLGGTQVAEGTVKIGTNAFGVLGSDMATLSVAEGAQLLDPLAANNAVAFLCFELAGTGPDCAGAYRVTTFKESACNSGWLAGLTLTGDTLFGRDDYGTDLVADNYYTLPLKLNGHTLTYRSPKATGQNATRLDLANVQGEGPGTLVISDNVNLYPMKAASVLPEVTLVIEPNAEYWTGSDAVGQDITVSNLVYRSASSNSQTAHTTTVLGCYTLASTASEPKVKLGDAEHLSTVLDLSGRNTPAQRLTFAEGSTVLVKAGCQKEWLVTWSGKPANVTFVSGQKNGYLQVLEEGIRFISGLTIIVR